MQADVLAQPAAQGGEDEGYLEVGERCLPHPAAREANLHAPSHVEQNVPRENSMLRHPRPIPFLCGERELLPCRQEMVTVYTTLRRNPTVSRHDFERS